MANTLTYTVYTWHGGDDENDTDRELVDGWLVAERGLSLWDVRAEL